MFHRGMLPDLEHRLEVAYDGHCPPQLAPRAAMRYLVVVSFIGCIFAAGCRPTSSAPAAGGAPPAQDTTVAGRAAFLLNASPVFDPSRSMEREAAFIRAVRDLLLRANVSDSVAAQVDSTDEATLILETLLEGRITTIRVTSPIRDFRVEVRPWRYRTSTTVPWSTVRADTSIRRPAAGYQFRYRPPGAARDTVVDEPCADPCDVHLPR